MKLCQVSEREGREMVPCPNPAVFVAWSEDFPEARWYRCRAHRPSPIQFDRIATIEDFQAMSAPANDADWEEAARASAEAHEGEDRPLGPGSHWDGPLDGEHCQANVVRAMSEDEYAKVLRDYAGVNIAMGENDAAFNLARERYSKEKRRLDVEVNSLAPKVRTRLAEFPVSAVKIRLPRGYDVATVELATRKVIRVDAMTQVDIERERQGDLFGASDTERPPKRRKVDRDEPGDPATDTSGLALAESKGEALPTPAKDPSAIVRRRRSNGKAPDPEGTHA